MQKLLTELASVQRQIEKLESRADAVRKDIGAEIKVECAYGTRTDSELKSVVSKSNLAYFGNSRGLRTVNTQALLDALYEGHLTNEYTIHLCNAILKK